MNKELAWNSGMMSGIKGSETTIGDRGSKYKWRRDGEKRSCM